MILCSRQWGETEAVQWHVRERGQNGGGLEGAQRGRRTCPAGRLQRQWAMTRTRQDQCVSIQSGGALNHLPRSLGVFNRKKKKGVFSSRGSGTVKLPVTDVQTFGIIFVPYFSAQCSVNLQTLSICPSKCRFHLSLLCLSSCHLMAVKFNLAIGDF